MRHLTYTFLLFSLLLRLVSTWTHTLESSLASLSSYLSASIFSLHHQTCLVLPGCLLVYKGMRWWKGLKCLHHGVLCRYWWYVALFLSSLSTYVWLLRSWKEDWMIKRLLHCSHLRITLSEFLLASLLVDVLHSITTLSNTFQSALAMISNILHSITQTDSTVFPISSFHTWLQCLFTLLMLILPWSVHTPLLFSVTALHQVLSLLSLTSMLLRAPTDIVRVRNILMLTGCMD
jgi:hypothetical protein